MERTQSGHQSAARCCIGWGTRSILLQTAPQQKMVQHAEGPSSSTNSRASQEAKEKQRHRPPHLQLSLEHRLLLHPPTFEEDVAGVRQLRQLLLEAVHAGGDSHPAGTASWAAQGRPATSGKKRRREKWQQWRRAASGGPGLDANDRSMLPRNLRVEQKAAGRRCGRGAWGTRGRRAGRAAATASRTI